MRVQPTGVITFLTLMMASATVHACPGCSVGPLRSVPGFWLLSLESGVAVLVLSAFLERPFVTMAGVKQHALAHSIVATALTAAPLFIGAWAMLIVGFNARNEFLILIWVPVSILMSASIKYAWLNRKRSIWRGAVKLWPIAVGLLLSSVVVAILPLLQMPFGFGTQRHAANVAPVRPFAALLTVAAGFVMVLVTVGSTKQDSVEVPQERGFEILPVSGER
jgi:hypothetical protein